MLEKHCVRDAFTTERLQDKQFFLFSIIFSLFFFYSSIGMSKDQREAGADKAEPLMGSRIRQRARKVDRVAASLRNLPRCKWILHLPWEI